MAQQKKKIKEISEKTSWVWYLLPIFFSLAGGIIGYFLLRDKDEKTAKRLIWIPLIIFVVIIAIGIMFGLMEIILGL